MINLEQTQGLAGRTVALGRIVTGSSLVMESIGRRERGSHRLSHPCGEMLLLAARWDRDNSCPRLGEGRHERMRKVFLQNGLAGDVLQALACFGGVLQ